MNEENMRPLKGAMPKYFTGPVAKSTITVKPYYDNSANIVISTFESQAEIFLNKEEIKNLITDLMKML